MPALNETLKKLNKSYTNNQIQLNPQVKLKLKKLPSGVFPFDYATGGGFPVGRMTEIFGGESSNKSNLCMLTIANQQRLDKGCYCVLVDAENSFDPEWAKKLGIDIERLVLVQTESGEQVQSLVEQFLLTDEVKLIVIDSIAALMPVSELEANVDKALVGNHAKFVGRMIRSINSIQMNLREKNRFPTVIFINQIRMKIGVLYGSPEYTPGGQALKYFCSLRARLWGKDIVDNAYSKELPCRKQTSVILKKWKSQVLSTSCDFEMITVSYGDYESGDIDCVNQLFYHLNEFGWIGAGSGANKYILDVAGVKEGFQTQSALKEFLAKDALARTTIASACIEAALNTKGGHAHKDKTSS